MSAARALMLAGHEPVVIAPPGKVPARGETLSPRALPFLEKLGWESLLDGAAAIRGEGRFSVWGGVALRRAQGDEGLGFHVDRLLLETRMAASLEGVLRVPQLVSGIEHRTDRVVIRLGNGEETSAPVAIDCTGRAALSSGGAANRRRLDKLVALWTVVALPDDVETLAATLVEAVALGWWYTSVLPGRRLMVGLFTDSDLLPGGASRRGFALNGLLADAPNTASRIESLGIEAALAAGVPEVSAAASVIGSRLVDGRILRAGDAAAATDPLGANGLATGIWSGMTAAEAALALLDGDGAAAERYEQSYLEGIARQLGSQLGLYAAERRFADAPFWSRRSG